MGLSGAEGTAFPDNPRERPPGEESETLGDLVLYYYQHVTTACEKGTLMPPLPVVADVVKVEISGLYHDAKWLNIYYAHYTGGPPSAGDLVAYVSALESSVVVQYLAEMSVDNEVTLLKAIDLASYTGATGELVISGSFGSRAGDFMPAGVAMVGSQEINRRYRGGHPRKYLPWGTAGTMASGSTTQWDSAFLADCQTKFDDVNTSLVGGPYGSTNFDYACNVSYRNGGAIRVTPVVDIVTAHIVRPRISSQRRRLGKVGG